MKKRRKKRRKRTTKIKRKTKIKKEDKKDEAAKPVKKVVYPPTPFEKTTKRLKVFSKNSKVVFDNWNQPATKMFYQELLNEPILLNALAVSKPKPVPLNALVLSKEIRTTDPSFQ